MGIAVTRKTVVEDIEQLKEFGFEVICIKSTQNRYSIGGRSFELPRDENRMNTDNYNGKSLFTCVEPITRENL
jgi:biotin operon repressor